MMLAGMRLIETTAGDRSERVLKNEEERPALLRERFGVVVEGPFRPARQRLEYSCEARLLHGIEQLR